MRVHNLERWLKCLVTAVLSIAGSAWARGAAAVEPALAIYPEPAAVTYTEDLGGARAEGGAAGCAIRFHQTELGNHASRCADHYTEWRDRSLTMRSNWR
jgi:hypothetical protein